MKKLLFGLSILCGITIRAQQTFSLTDTTPVTVNGLKAGYSITDESEKSVGKKGDFSRYKIYFYLTNTSNEAKIMYKKPNFHGHFGPLSNIVALFKCTNATGARMTNKQATMELQPCRIDATVDDKECGTEKIVQNTRQVDIGFWIKPGETVSKTYPMIVPLGQKPVVTVTLYPEPANQVGTMMNNTYDQNQNYQQEFVRIKNLSNTTYLHNQDGPVNCSPIDFNWWSAQWEILPVNGSNYFQIRNRWKNTFLSSENSSLLSDNGNSLNAQWSIEETPTSNVYYIKNAAGNARLLLQNGQLKISNTYNSNDAAAQWVIEK